MPKTRPYQCTFSRGELSPLLYGRFDLEWYFNAAKRVENFIPIPQGALTRRWGWHFVGPTKTKVTFNDICCLIPFQFSTEQAYVLEFGEHYIRVYKDGAQIQTAGADLVTNGAFPANINDWDDRSEGGGEIVWNAGGRLELGHTVAPPSTDDISWTEQDIPTTVGLVYTLTFDVVGSGAYLRIGSSSKGSEVLHDQFFDVGTGHTVTFIAAAGAVTYIQFLRHYPLPATHPKIDNVTCTTQTALEITTTYDEEEVGDIAYCQSADTLYLVHPNHPPATLTRSSHTSWVLSDIVFDPPPTYEADTDISLGTTTLTPAAVTGTGINFVASAGVFLAADEGRTIKYGASRATIVTYTNITTVVCDITVDFPDTDPIAAGEWLLDKSPVCDLNPGKTKEGAVCNFVSSTPAAAFRVADVGKYIKIHGGMAVITSFTNNYTVRGTILSELQDTTATPYWTLEVAAWDAVRGYPRAVAFFEGRLFFAGTTEQPNTIWGTATGDYASMVISSLVDSAVEFDINAMEVNVIQWLSPSKYLLAGTNGEEFPLKADSGPIAPDNPPDLKSESTTGSSSARPVRVGSSTFFIQAMKRKLIEYSFSWETESHGGIDRSIMSEHITESGLEQIVYQQEPYPIIWGRREDGNLISFTYHKDEKVFGWAIHPTEGTVESMCVVSNPTSFRQDVYAIINRDIDGVATRFIEHLDPDLYVDCGLTYAGDGATILSGLNHLIGEEVVIVGDGSVHPPQTVDANGQVTLARSVTTAQVGLAFTSTVQTLRPEVSLGGSTSQGKKKHRTDINIRFHETGSGVTVNGDIVSFRAGDDMDEAVPLFSDDKMVRNLGWDKDGFVTIIQTQPMPITVLGVFGDIEIEP